MKKVLQAIIGFYQIAISPYLGQNCRFTPTCSCYTKECLDHFPVHKALWYSFVRILKCHPFHPGGYNPVPGTDATQRHKEKDLTQINSKDVF